MGVSQAGKLILNALKNVGAYDDVGHLEHGLVFLVFAPLFLDSLTKGPDLANLICTGLSVLLFGPVSAATHCMISRVIGEGELSAGEFSKR